MAARVSFFMVWYWATRSSIGTFTEFSRRSKGPSRGARRLGVAQDSAGFGVGGSAGGTGGRPARDREPLAALAHPADAPGRHADHQPVGRHVRRNHGARPDEGELAQGGAADDGRVG